MGTESDKAIKLSIFLTFYRRFNILDIKTLIIYRKQYLFDDDEKDDKHDDRNNNDDDQDGDRDYNHPNKDRSPRRRN